MWLQEFVHVNNYYTFYTYYCRLEISKGRKYHGLFYFMCGLRSGGSYLTEEKMKCWQNVDIFELIDVIMILYIPTRARGFEHLVMLAKKWRGSRKVMAT